MSVESIYDRDFGSENSDCVEQEQNSVAKLIIQLRNITRELQNLTGDNNYVWSLAQRFIINGKPLSRMATVSD